MHPPDQSAGPIRKTSSWDTLSTQSWTYHHDASSCCNNMTHHHSASCNVLSRNTLLIQAGCVIVMHRYDASWRFMIIVASWMASMDVVSITPAEEEWGGPGCKAGATENMWDYYKLETKFLHTCHFLFFVSRPPLSCRVGKLRGAMHRGNGASRLSQRKS